MQELQGNQLLHEITPQAFIISEFSRLQEFERRTRSHISQRLTQQDQELCLPISLKSQMLVTHFIIETTHEKAFKQLMQFLVAESASLSDSLQFKKMLSTNFKIIDRTSCMVEAIAFSRSFKLTFIMRQQFLSSYMQEHSLKLEKSRSGFENSVNQLMRVLIKKVQLWGYLPNTNPPASHITQLMNISHIMKKYSREDEAAETDVLLGLCLITARRFNQAVELLKKVSKLFVMKYDSGKNNDGLSIGGGGGGSHNSNANQSRSLLANQTKHDSEIFYFNWANCANSTGLLNNNKKNLLRAAKIELLIADATNHPSMMLDKVLAFNRATAYFSGKTQTELNIKSHDMYTALLKLCPQLMCFLIKTLYDRFEPLKITAIKALQFVLESLGCSAGNYLPQLLKSIIATYPTNIAHTNSLNVGIEDDNSRNPMTNTTSYLTINPNAKLVMDHYHHLLQSVLNLMSSLSRSICRVIFHEVVLPSIFLPEITNEIRCYILRIAEKVITLSLGDLDLPVTFIANLLNMSDNKGPIFANSKNNSPMLYHCQRVWDAIKGKYLSSLNGLKLVKISQWVNQTLVIFCQHQVSSISLYSFQQILETVTVIYGKKTTRNTVVFPIQPILYLLNVSLNQNVFPFEKVLNALVIVLKTFIACNEESPIADQIVTKIISKTNFSSLNPKQLKMLFEVLKLCKNGDTNWLDRFLQCVPHSTYDQTFVVLDELLIRCDITNPTLVAKIINTLLDQYTVKGKAHKHTKQLLSELLLKNNLIQDFLEICIAKNQQPSGQARQLSRFKIRQFDSKMYTKAFELFSQKLNFAGEVLPMMKKQKLLEMIENGFVQQMSKCLVKLVQSRNSKNRSRSAGIVKSFLDCFEEDTIVQTEKNMITHSHLLFAKSILTVLKAQLSEFKQSKMQLSTLVMVRRIFSEILKVDTAFLKSYKNSQPSTINLMDIDHIDYSLSCKLKISDPSYLNLRIRQILKLWPLIIPYMNSPWGFIREASCQLIQEFVSVDLYRYKVCYQRKLIELISPIIANLLDSQDHSDRIYGLLIYGKTVGMAGLYEDKSCISAFRERSAHFKEHFIKIETFESDWNQQVTELSSTIVQLALDKQLRNTVRRRSTTDKRSINNVISSSFFSINLDIGFEPQEQETFVNLSANIQNFLKQAEAIPQLSDIEERSNEQYCFQPSFLQNPDDFMVFWLEREDFQNINQRLELFRRPLCFYQQTDLHQNSLANNPNPQIPPHDSYDYPTTATTTQKVQQTKQEQLDFQDLGIIQIDDQQWTDYEHEVRLVQKLPAKRKYKLSPNLASPSGNNPSKIDALHQGEEIGEKIPKSVNPNISQLPQKQSLPSHKKQEIEDIPVIEEAQDKNDDGSSIENMKLEENSNDQDQQLQQDKQIQHQNHKNQAIHEKAEKILKKKLKPKPAFEKQIKDEFERKTKTTPTRRKPSSANPAKTKKSTKK